MSGGAFVTVSELESSWRTLTAPQRVYAGQLLESAADKIREEYLAAKGVDIDAASSAARTVSIEMVRTAIETGAYVGHLTYSRTEGPRAKAGTLLNPGGLLVFTDWHREQLGLPVHALAEAFFDDCSDARY